MGSIEKENREIVRQRPSSYHGGNRREVIERRYVRRQDAYKDDSDEEVQERRVIREIRRPVSGDRIIQRRIICDGSDSDDYLRQYQRQVATQEDLESEDGNVVYVKRPASRVFYVRENSRDNARSDEYYTQKSEKQFVMKKPREVELRDHVEKRNVNTVMMRNIQEKDRWLDEYEVSDDEPNTRDVGVQMTTQYRVAQPPPPPPSPKKKSRNVGTQTKQKKPPPPPPRMPTPPPREPTPPPPPKPKAKPKPPPPPPKIELAPENPIVIPESKPKKKVRSSYHYVRVGGGWKKVRHRPSEQYTIQFAGLNRALIDKYLAVTYHGHTGFWTY